MKRISVLLAEDHAVVREGLRALLGGEPDIEVVGEARDGRVAVEMVRQLHPDVVVMDIAMPLLNGIEATQQILARTPTAKVIILSAHDDDAYVEQVVAIGAAGYVLKHASHADLERAIREVHKGRKYYSPAIARRLDGGTGLPWTGRDRVKRRIAGLSRRETEVLQMIAEGLANKQVAAELGISIKTVEKHRQHLMEKLDIHDVAGLTRYAIRVGIIDGGIQLTGAEPPAGPIRRPGA